MRVRDLAYVLTIGAVFGLGSAYAALKGRFPFGAVHLGPWTTWPASGGREIDPYARAILARGPLLPLGLGEGLLLIASVDDDGRALQGECRYRLTGVLPATRGWTLNVVSRSGSLPGERGGLTDSHIVRAEDGQMLITLAATVSGGNWLQSAATGPIELWLRLYDTPVSGTVGALRRSMLPSIQRLDCP